LNTGTKISSGSILPVFLKQGGLKLLVIGGGKTAAGTLQNILSCLPKASVTIIAEQPEEEIKVLSTQYPHLVIHLKPFEISDLDKKNMVIIAGNDPTINDTIRHEAYSRHLLVYVPDHPHSSNFHLGDIISKDDVQVAVSANGKTLAVTDQIRKLLSKPILQVNEERRWRSIATKLIVVFALMVVGHIIISYLPLPSFKEILTSVKPYFNYEFLFFIMAGFIAQMVDGTLGMGYGVTCATCLITLGIAPVSVSASIHTSEIFTTGVSGYSHYKFGNVNKKLFRHLVIPGVIGAILGAVLLVILGEKAGKWLLPVMALYAMFLGFKILIRAFQQGRPNKKVKRIGWLAWVGGFLDSFGGGGWGPIVTSSLIAKGRSPKYTIGSVNLTEFFVTLASAATFFATVGIQHWNIVLGLLVGGSIAAPFAARLAGKLPRKTMMIAVGIMVMIWCARMIIKSFF
jgi:uncharacterized protein